MVAQVDGILSERWHRRMKDIRKVMCWIFAFTSLLHLLVAFRFILHIIQRQYVYPLSRNIFIAALFSVLVAIISGVAWWTIWREKRSARIWGVAGSIMNILIFFRPMILPTRSSWDHHIGALYIGVVGLVVFVWSGNQHTPDSPPNQHLDSKSEGSSL